MHRSLLVVVFAFGLAALAPAQPPGFPRGPQFPPTPQFPQPPQPNFPRPPGMPAPPALPAPGFGGGADTNGGECSSCKRQITWTGGSANAPKKCPHCGVRFDYVDNDDGTRTNLKTGKTSAKLPAWAGILITVAVVGLLAVVGIVWGVVKAAGSGGRSKSRKKKRRPVRRDDFDDEDDRPARKARFAEPDEDEADGGYDVVEPPRRVAKARLIEPGDPSRRPPGNGGGA